MICSYSARRSKWGAAVTSSMNRMMRSEAFIELKCSGLRSGYSWRLHPESWHHLKVTGIDSRCEYLFLTAVCGPYVYLKFYAVSCIQIFKKATSGRNASVNKGKIPLVECSI